MNFDTNREVPESLYISLTSRNNPDGVTNSEILTQFAQPLRFARDRFEVGLLSTGFTTDSHTELQSNVTTSSSLFPGYKEPTVTKLTVTKTRDEIFFFATEDVNNVTVAKKFYFVAFVEKEEPEGKVFFILQNNNMDESQFIFFPSDLGSLLGFPFRRCFSAGEYYANEIAETASLEKIKPQQKFEIELITLQEQRDLIQVYERQEFLMYYKCVGTDDRTNFFTNVSKKLRERGYLIDFSWDKDLKSIIKVQTLSNHSEDFIILPKELLSCLNFENDMFNVGVHTSTEPFDQEKFKEIKENDFIWFRLRYWFANRFPMGEPVTIEHRDVISTINNALRKYSARSMSFAMENGALKFSAVDENVKVVLPPLVNKYFGFSESAEFPTSEEINVDKQVEEEEEKDEFIEEKTAEGEIISSDQGSHVFILTNVTENQFHGDKMLPAIRVIPTPEANNKFREIYSPVIYQPLTCSDVSQLRVKFTDAFGRQLRFKEGTETTLQLHFKSKYA